MFIRKLKPRFFLPAGDAFPHEGDSFFIPYPSMSKWL